MVFGGRIHDTNPMDTLNLFADDYTSAGGLSSNHKLVLTKPSRPKSSVLPHHQFEGSRKQLKLRLQSGKHFPEPLHSTKSKMSHLENSKQGWMSPEASPVVKDFNQVSRILS